MVAENFSRALVLSRGGNKTLSMGTRLTIFEMTANQLMDLFYHFPPFSQGSGGPSGSLLFETDLQDVERQLMPDYVNSALSWHFY